MSYAYLMILTIIAESTANITTRSLQSATISISDSTGNEDTLNNSKQQLINAHSIIDINTSTDLLELPNATNNLNDTVLITVPSNTIEANNYNPTIPLIGAVNTSGEIPIPQDATQTPIPEKKSV